MNLSLFAPFRGSQGRSRRSILNCGAATHEEIFSYCERPSYSRREIQRRDDRVERMEDCRTGAASSRCRRLRFRPLERQVSTPSGIYHRRRSAHTHCASSLSIPSSRRSFGLWTKTCAGMRLIANPCKYSRANPRACQGEEPSGERANG